MTDTASSDVSAMTPIPYRVRSRADENRECSTLHLAPVHGPLGTPRPGEFMMMYVFGIGEIAVSVSGVTAAPDTTLAHTVRAVGAVSTALRDAQVGTVIGMRGPFGTGWGLQDVTGRDLILVAGGVGLAPLRPVVLAVLADRAAHGTVTLIAGARSHDEFLFGAELRRWSQDRTIGVQLTVDIPVQGWSGEVGLVTEPLRRLALRPGKTTAFLCGPEPMMRSCSEELLRKGVPAGDIRVALERNMACGVGWCGHCQLGPLLLCRDGPVVGYDVAGPLLAVREL